MEEYELSFRYSFYDENPKSNVPFWVAASFKRTYWKGLSAPQYLVDRLRNQLPFNFKEQGEAAIEILGGKCQEGMMQVIMEIVTDAEKISEQLKDAGFYRGFEPIK